jgi:tetratricopeptide (TPR) repeat protein
MTIHHLSESILGMYALEPAVISNRAEVEVHLAACDECRSALEAIKIFDAALGDTDAWPSKVADADHSAAVEQLRAFAARAAEEDREALRLLAEYEEPDAAPRFVWADIPNKPEYRTGGVARLLCKRANGMCTRKPLYALALAEAAVRISEDLPDASYPRSTIHELRGEAWKEQTNSLVSLGRFDDALAALSYAETEYRQLPHEGLGLVAVMYIRAFILFEQEQFEAADQLARESAEEALHLGSTDRCMRALNPQGEIRLLRRDLHGAIELFIRVLRHGEETSDRVWIARGARALGVQQDGRIESDSCACASGRWGHQRVEGEDLRLRIGRLAVLKENVRRGALPIEGENGGKARSVQPAEGVDEHRRHMNGLAENAKLEDKRPLRTVDLIGVERRAEEERLPHVIGSKALSNRQRRLEDLCIRALTPPLA